MGKRVFCCFLETTEKVTIITRKKAIDKYIIFMHKTLTLNTI